MRDALRRGFAKAKAFLLRELSAVGTRGWPRESTKKHGDRSRGCGQQGSSHWLLVTGTEETEENVAKGLGPKGASRKTDRDGESSHEGESRHEAGRI